jgi:CBS domain-containing protein
MKVREIMSAKPITCGPDSKLESVARKMVECDCGMIPVVDDNQEPVGVVTDRDIVCRAVANGRNPLDLSAKDVMTDDCVTVSPEADIEECARQLEQHQLRRALVCDEAGRVCGIVAQADLAREMAVAETGEIVREVSKPSFAPARA